MPRSVRIASLSRLLACAGLCLGLPGPAQAITIVSNLQNDFSGSVVVQGNLWVAQSFTTDTTLYTLDSITVGALGIDTSSDIEFRLHADAADQPGSLIHVLSGPGMPTTFTEYTYLPTATVSLDASTKYWIVARTLPGNGDYRWVRTLDMSEVGPGTLGGTVGSGDGGSTWGTESTDIALLLGVEGTVVPQPSTLGLLAIGLAALGLRRHRKPGATVA